MLISCVVYRSGREVVDIPTTRIDEYRHSFTYADRMVSLDMWRGSDWHGQLQLHDCQALAWVQP